MSDTLWYILASTIPLAIIIMVVSFLITNKKIKKTKDQFVEKNPKANAVAKRKDHGQLLWNLKSKCKDPLGDLEMEFILNTILRNQYKTSVVFNSQSIYEETSIKKIANQKIANQKIETTQYDFGLLFNSKNLKKTFDILYKNLNINGMIIIVNAKKRNKNVKKLLEYLKLIGVRNQYEKIGNGVVLVVK